MAIARWSPFLELEAFDRRMRRLFDEAGLAPATLPNADVYETDDEFVVELEAPGYEEKDLDIEVFDRVLCIKGTRTETKEETEKRFQRRERLEATFERRFTLPADVDSEAVKASFAKGVLEVHAPRAKEAAPTKVAIGKK
jgi:HSP20 family protein